MRKWIKKYERSFMLGLVIFLLVIFTVAADFADALKPAGDSDEVDPRDVAGTFSLLPGETVEVSYEELDAARNQLRLYFTFQSGGRNNRVNDTEVWTYLILRKAAEREGIAVSNAEVDDFLRQRFPGFLYDDPARYKDVVRTQFRSNVRYFEETIRSVLATDRVRDLYRQTFTVAPPATREDMVKKYAEQPIEYARVSWAALDAGRYMEAAEKELAEAEDKDALLADFYKKDPSVKLETIRFQHPRRYVFEVLYCIHRALTEENYKRVEALFGRAYPELDLTKLERPVKDMHEFYGFYRDRLLEEAGTNWDEVKRDADEAGGWIRDPNDKPKDEPGDDDGKPGDEEEPGDEDEPGGEDEPKAPELSQDEIERQRKARNEAGYQIVRDQIDRELRVRGMFQWFHEQARKDEKQSLKVLFDHLKKFDDPENPVCVTEPDKGCLIVYREFPDGLTGEDLEEIEDCGVKFTHNYRLRMGQIGDSDLPKLHPKADVLGEMGHGRQITRLLDVKQRRRKTFEELEPGEKTDLENDYYLPHAARAKAEAALEELRKKANEGMETDAVLEEARKVLSARVHRDEWIEASDEIMAEPDESIYWPDEYLHMKDRYFLHRELARVLAADRAAKKLGAGSWLEIRTDPRDDDDEDPGTAYLILLLERKKPGPDTMPPSEFNTFLGLARERRRLEEQDRWGSRTRQLIKDFELEFRGDMQQRIEKELEEREANRR